MEKAVLSWVKNIELDFWRQAQFRPRNYLTFPLRRRLLSYVWKIYVLPTVHHESSGKTEKEGHLNPLLASSFVNGLSNDWKKYPKAILF